MEIYRNCADKGSNSSFENNPPTAHLMNVVGSEHVESPHLVVFHIRIVESCFVAGHLQDLHERVQHVLSVVLQLKIQCLLLVLQLTITIL